MRPPFITKEREGMNIPKIKWMTPSQLKLDLSKRYGPKSSGPPKPGAPFR